jgi:hypothetical protein
VWPPAPRAPGHPRPAGAWPAPTLQVHAQVLRRFGQARHQRHAVDQVHRPAVAGQVVQVAAKAFAHMQQALGERVMLRKAARSAPAMIGMPMNEVSRRVLRRRGSRAPTSRAS